MEIKDLSTLQISDLQGNWISQTMSKFVIMTFGDADLKIATTSMQGITQSLQIVASKDKVQLLTTDTKAEIEFASDKFLIAKMVNVPSGMSSYKGDYLVFVKSS
ncbi:MAG: hypothetical protein JNM22_18330 [Saprospiraceae bacterium]|nr:hypothetical protein [Saprospiraceae bacterium]